MVLTRKRIRDLGGKERHGMGSEWLDVFGLAHF